MTKQIFARTMVATALFTASVLPVLAETTGSTDTSGTATPPPATSATKPAGEGKNMMMKRGEGNKMMRLKNDSGATATTAVKIDAACVKSAIDKRENAIIAAVDTLAGALKSAYTTRRDALKAAWDLTDVKARNSAIRAAGKAFTVADRTARKAANETRRAAWTTFATDRKACGGGVGSDGEANQSLDKGL